MLRRRAAICLPSFLALASMISGCYREQAAVVPKGSGEERRFHGNYPIRIVCTTGPVTDMLRNLGGEQTHVAGLMGPGVDPHLYTAVPADIEQLAAADMIFYNGMHLEGRMADLLEDLSDSKPTYAVTHSLVVAEDQRLRKPPEFEGYYDPHAWHDPKLWAECVKYVAEVLAEFDPDNRDEYLRNCDVYLAELKLADEYCREQLSTIAPERRVLVSTHDAFNYFCEAYGLDSMPLKGVSTEDEVTIGRMDEVVAFLVERKIKAVFAESATRPETLQAIIERCQSLGHDVTIAEHELYADALGPAGSGADNYLGMIKANVDTIVSALK